jgi:hypothetical protein
LAALVANSNELVAVDAGAFFSVTDRARSDRRSRVVHLALPKPSVLKRSLQSSPFCMSRSRSPTQTHTYTDTTERFFIAPPESSLRGRNTQDGRVRKRTKRDRFTVVPKHVLISNRRAADTSRKRRHRNSVNRIEVGRLAAGQLHRRPCERLIGGYERNTLTTIAADGYR